MGTILSPPPTSLTPWQCLALSLTLHLLPQSFNTTLCPPTRIPWLYPLPQKAKGKLELKELSRLEHCEAPGQKGMI